MATTAGTQQPAPVLPTDEPQELVLKRYDFVLQFCWQPRPAGQPPAAPAAAPATE